MPEDPTDARRPQAPASPGTRILVPNPFPKDDPRHARWLEIDRSMWEMDARRHAHLLRRMASAPVEQLHTFYVPAVVEKFDLAWKFYIGSVTTYEEAASCEKTLRESSASMYQWFCSFLDRRPPPLVSPGDLLGDLKLRLGARVAHWTAEAIHGAREATEASGQGTDGPGLVSATWEDVAIDFISDFSLCITVKTNTATLGYAEFGFDDRKARKPNLAWLTLRSLAENRGAISTSFAERRKTEKRMQEIRAALRAYLVKARVDIPRKANPLPYDKHKKKYNSRFRIGTRPSFNS